MARDTEPGSIHNPDPNLGGNPNSPGALISNPYAGYQPTYGGWPGAHAANSFGFDPNGGGGGGGGGHQAAGASPAPGVGFNTGDVVQGSDGIYYYRGADGKWVSTGSGNTGEDAAAAAIAAALGVGVGVARQFIGDAHNTYLQSGKTAKTLGQGTLVGKNPDGTYTVRMPDNSIAIKTLQEAGQIPGVTPFDIAEADKNEVYGRMRANEARWATGPMQMYNGGAVPGITDPGAPPGAPPPTANGSPDSGVNPAYQTVPTANWSPDSAVDPTQRPTDTTPPAGPPPAAPPSPPPAAPPPAEPPPATPTDPGGYTPPPSDLRGEARQPAPQGQPMISGMLPMGQQPPPASYGGDAARTGSGTSENSYGTMGGGDAVRGGGDAVGNYGTPGGSWQDYELGTRGLTDQYERGQQTYNLGQTGYTGGQTRQQYSQRIQDLQNQYNMGQSQFNLAHQTQSQGNEYNKMQQQTNQNEQMGQSRSISGMGLANAQPGHVAGIR